MAQYVDVYNRVWGDGDITNSIDIPASMNLLTFEVADGTTYTVGIPAGTYGFNGVARRADLVDEFNRQLESSGVPIKCYVGGVRGESKRYNCMVFQSKSDQKIVNITGSFIPHFED